MSDALFPRRASLLGAMLLAFLAGGCVHNDHAYYAPRVQHGGAYASHYYHDGALLLFDSAYGYYAVDGHAGHYFFHDHFYRYDHGHWQRSAKLRGPWHAARPHDVPHGVRQGHARRRSPEPRLHAQRRPAAGPARVPVRPRKARVEEPRAPAPRRSAARPAQREPAQSRRDVRNERREGEAKSRDARPAGPDRKKKREARAVEPGKRRGAAQRRARKPVEPETPEKQRKSRRR